MGLVRLSPLVFWFLSVGVPLGGQEDERPAEGADAPVSREEHDRLLEDLAELRREVSEMRDARTPSYRADEDGRLPDNRGGLYDKPFLRTAASRVHLGGYFDVEYRDPENARHDFRFHRLIPFIYADVHERVRFATEIEIEDGSDVAIEFAFVDLLIVDQLNFRGGALLDPLGKFNLIHDSPINDLTDRPLVSQFVLPTTLRELGMGFYGTLTSPESAWEVKYEAYLTSGFKGLDNDGNATISSAKGVRDARPHTDALDTRRFGDINNKFAGVGRLSVSPAVGTEVGFSAHSGAYDEAGDNNLTIAAIDGLVTIPEFRLSGLPVGPIEFQGEGGYAFVERDDFARASGVAGDMWGYYVQVNYHFMPSWLVENLSALFTRESTFTLVARWGEVDLDDHELERFTVGLNFRPIESTAIKIDYQFNTGTGSASTSADSDDAALFSLTTYF